MTAAEVAVFDFDGTLTRGDTLLPFLATVAPARVTRWAPAAVVGARRRRSERDRLKEELLGVVLRDVEPERLVRAGRSFAEGLLLRLLRPDTVAELRAHQAAGRTTVIASASPEVVVAPAAEVLGVDLAIATRLHVRDGRWRYHGPNLRGEAKLEAVRAVIDPWAPSARWVYGNLPDDGPLLEWADHPTVVRARARIASSQCPPTGPPRFRVRRRPRHVGTG